MPRTYEYHWCFGRHAHLEFPNGGDPIILPPSQIDTSEGCATISDAAGNLLFYTDGTDLWRKGDTTPALTGMGGSPSSTHSAIIVPPAGGGSVYHIFTVNDWDQNSQKPLNHMGVSLASLGAFPGPATFVHNPLPYTTANGFDGPDGASEHLIAIPHTDCQRYWVINISPKRNEFFVLRIDNDTRPTVGHSYTWQDYGMNFGSVANSGFCAKASPDGTMLAISNHRAHVIDIYNFDRSTGLMSSKAQIHDVEWPYGIEFSPNSKNIFFSEIRTGKYRGMAVPTGQVSAGAPFYTSSDITQPGSYRGAALQLGPNNKIYGIRCGRKELLSIDNPDATNPGGASNIGFKQTAVDALSNDILLPEEQRLGLPTFTRIADNCVTGGCCKEALSEVNDELAAQTADQPNTMDHCDGSDGSRPKDLKCEKAELPELAPTVHITWGASECDCLESDDIEVMNITICNPYHNVTLQNVTIPRITVVNEDGTPVATLPNKQQSPTIEITPVGPYCFGDIEGCTCVSREFSMRLRGAPSDNPYRIEIEEICYGISWCEQTKACFVFKICEDG